MGLFDQILGAVVPSGVAQKPISDVLDALVGSGGLLKSAEGEDASSDATNLPSGDSAGGLLGLLTRFQQAGHGDLINSWISSGENQPISPGQIGSALGPEIIRALAERTGLSEEDLTSHLSQVLPGLVDKLTPDGQLSGETGSSSMS